MKRTNKFWRKNERDIMEQLGLSPTANSGSTWLEKGDGQNDDVVCELKSTDAASYRLQVFDLHKLQHNAQVAHKLPVFAVQFIEHNEVYLVVKPGDLQVLAKVMGGERIDSQHFNQDAGFDWDEFLDEQPVKKAKRAISSSGSARKQWQKEREKAMDKTKYIK